MLGPGSGVGVVPSCIDGRWEDWGFSGVRTEDTVSGLLYTQPMEMNKAARLISTATQNQQEDIGWKGWTLTWVCRKDSMHFNRCIWLRHSHSRAVEVAHINQRV